jgi:hypothetical protein
VPVVETVMVDVSVVGVTETVEALNEPAAP